MTSHPRIETALQRFFEKEHIYENLDPSTRARNKQAVAASRPLVSNVGRCCRLGVSGVDRFA
jgi:hypothetical protein